MEVLEKRFSKKQQKKPTGIVAKKVRKFGEPSSSPTPPGAPAWAIKQTGKLYYSIIEYFVIAIVGADNRESEDEELNEDVIVRKSACPASLPESRFSSLHA
jgi:hypothetical protein